MELVASFLWSPWRFPCRFIIARSRYATFLLVPRGGRAHRRRVVTSLRATWWVRCNAGDRHAPRRAVHEIRRPHRRHDRDAVTGDARCALYALARPRPHPRAI